MKTLLILNEASYGSERIRCRGAHHSTLDEFIQWTAWAEKARVF
jgi:hypothetical protein